MALILGTILHLALAALAQSLPTLLFLTQLQGHFLPITELY